MGLPVLEHDVHGLAARVLEVDPPDLTDAVLLRDGRETTDYVRNGGVCLFRTRQPPHIDERCNRQRTASGRHHKGQLTSCNSASREPRLAAETGRCISLLAALITSCRIYRVRDCVAFLQCVVSGLPQRVDPFEE